MHGLWRYFREVEKNWLNYACLNPNRTSGASPVLCRKFPTKPAYERARTGNRTETAGKAKIRRWHTHVLFFSFYLPEIIHVT